MNVLAILAGFLEKTFTEVDFFGVALEARLLKDNLMAPSHRHLKAEHSFRIGKSLFTSLLSFPSILNVCVLHRFF